MREGKGKKGKVRERMEKEGKERGGESQNTSSAIPAHAPV